MEAGTMLQMKDNVKLDELPMSEVVREGSIDPHVTKRGSLSSLRNPLSTSCARHGYENDFLPSELLANLTNQFETIEDLGPQNKAYLRRGKAFPKVHPKRPPDNLWNHSKTRERFKHLTDQPPCTCGAGRDISFLYDAVSSKKSSAGSPSKGARQSADGADGNIEETKKQGIQVPETAGTEQEDEALNAAQMDGTKIQESLLPSEFHIVKNPGVLGLEIRDEKFTTTMDNHGKHLTLFPSLKPSGRQEAVLLKKTMNELLSRVGVIDLKEDIDQPTQIHALLDLVKQEQNIYNVVFSEVIRQVTVECVERGEVLADLRKRYATLLDKIPRHVKSLHEEVLAQRALDRRLTEEITRFRTSVSLLTRELHTVQEHDREVTKKASETQDELKEALIESERNANLLAEYHELYELQRRRLEFQISKLIEERDLWAGAAYTLSVKVTRKNDLKTALRLHLHEKAWYKLASHFTIVLSDIDSKHLQQLTSCIQRWQDITQKINSKLLAYEKEAHRRLTNIQNQIKHWGKQFSAFVSPDEGVIHSPEQSTIAKLCTDMKNWEDVFNSEIERFSGDVLLSCEDSLVEMNIIVDDWNEAALKIFNQHPSVNSNERRVEHELMLSLNKEIDKLHKNIKLRMTGENGLAKGIIHFINVLDSLSTKLSAYTRGSEVILDPEWVRLADFLKNEWDDLLSELIEILNREINSDDIIETSKENVHIHTVKSLSKLAQKWLTQTSNSIGNADASMLDQVSNNHSNMVRWMVTILLRLAPNLDGDPLDESESIGNGGVGTAIISESVTEEIEEKAKLQFRSLRRLTRNLYLCCKAIVDNSSKEYGNVGGVSIDVLDVERIKAECDGWVRTAILLVEELSGETIEESENEEENGNGEAVKTMYAEPSNRSAAWSTTKDSEENSSMTTSNHGSSNDVVESKESGKRSEKRVEEKPNADGKVKAKTKPQKSSDSIKMHVVGHDENVTLQVLDADSISKGAPSHLKSGKYFPLIRDLFNLIIICISAKVTLSSSLLFILWLLCECFLDVRLLHA